MRVLTFAFVLILMSLTNNQFVGAQSAHPPVLPADLIMTAGERNSDGNIVLSLVLWDSQRGEFRAFYKETSADVASLKALSWSPDGKLLAFSRGERQKNQALFSKKEICVINREAVVIACSQNLTESILGASQARGDFIQRVSWSVDSQYMYFAFSTPSQPDSVLLEMEAYTGKISREVFRYQDTTGGRWPADLSWTKDFAHLLAGVGYMGRTRAYGIDMIAVDTYEITYLKPVLGGLSYVCSGFSPNGQYAAARIVEQLADGKINEGLLIFDLNGQVIASIDSLDGAGERNLYCPTWLPNSLGFYWVGSDDNAPLAQVFQYTLATNQIGVVYSQPDSPNLVDNPLKGAIQTISDVYIVDARYIAATGMGSLNSSGDYGNFQVIVITPTGVGQDLLGNYLFTQDALWLPPVQETTPTPTPTLVPTNTPTPTFTPSRTPTITPTVPANFTPLMLYSACSENPLQTRRWSVINANQFPLAYTWRLENSDQQGEGVAYPYALHFWETTTIGDPYDEESNVMSIYVGGVLQSSSISNGGVCGGGWQ
jgi:hypothetical protein